MYKSKKISKKPTARRALSYKPYKNPVSKTLVISPKRLVTSIQALSTSIVKLSLSFQLSDIIGVGNYTAIYDQYRINKIKLFIIGETQVALPATGPAYGDYISVIDYDDADTAYSSANELLAFATSRVHRAGCSDTISFVPRVAQGTWQGTLTPGGMAPKMQWLDCAYPGVYHYGYKSCTTQSTSTNINAWTIYAQYFIEFKNNK